MITLQQAIREIEYLFAGAKIIRTWDNKEVTEVAFSYEGEELELYSSIDPFYNDEIPYSIIKL